MNFLDSVPHFESYFILISHSPYACIIFVITVVFLSPSIMQYHVPLCMATCVFNFFVRISWVG